MSMRFDERKSKAQSAVVEFLSSYSSPRGLSEDAKVSQIKNIADAFARRLPLGDFSRFESDLEKTFTAIRDDHKGYAWPVQSEFVDAMPKGAARTGAKLQQYKPDEKEAMAKRMNAGEAIPDAWVWGQLSFSLVSNGLVPRDALDSYRRAAVANFEDVFKGDAYGMMQAKYGDVVGAYFAEEPQRVGGAA